MNETAPVRPADQAPSPGAETRRARSAREMAWAQFRRRRLNLVGLSTIGVLGLVALFADFLASDKPVLMRLDGRLYVFPNLFEPGALRADDLASLRARLVPDRGDWLITAAIPFGPYTVDLSLDPPKPPDGAHLLGTDEVGRDVLARMIHGARVSLLVGFVAVGIYVLIGLFVGALAGYYGGWVDAAISRVIEMVLTFPTLLIVLAILGMMPKPNLWMLMVVIGITRWPDVARLVRAEFLRLKTQDFVAASRALGGSDLRVIVRHILPNAVGPVFVAATFGVAGAILLESTLSFLGFGVQPPTPSWGEILTQAQRYVTYPGAWWLTIYPGLAIFITVTSYNLVGEGLRDAIDPRLRG